MDTHLYDRPYGQRATQILCIITYMHSSSFDSRVVYDTNFIYIIVVCCDIELIVYEVGKCNSKRRSIDLKLNSMQWAANPPLLTSDNSRLEDS